MLPVIAEGSSAPVVAGSEQFNQDFFGSAFEGFGSSMRFLRAKKMDFRLSSGGGGETVIENGKVIGVLLGVAPFNHCSWYARKYQEGQEPSAPDLLWVQKTPDTFPDALPAQFRQKQMVGGVARWDFRIARRTVWGLVHVSTDGQWTLDLDNPVVFDMTSASMYGKSDPRTNSYKWTGLRSFCEQYSNAVTRVNPAMFLTQINIDPNSPVQGVVVFRPQMNPQTGGPAWLDSATYGEVVRMAQSSLVADMLKINEILSYDNAASQPYTPPVQTATPPVQTAATVRQDPAQPGRVQPASLFNQGQATPSESLLADAQAVINQAQSQRPKMSNAAQEGVANIMSSLDF